MRMRSMVAMAMLGLAAYPGAAVGQGKSLKDQLVGTWLIVSVDNVRDDGSKVEQFGSNPKGILIYMADGYFALLNSREDLPKFASKTATRALPKRTRP